MRQKRLHYLLVHDLDHVDAAVKLSSGWRGPQLITQNVKVRVALAERGIACKWALPSTWAPTHARRLDLTEQLLARTYEDFGDKVTDAYGTWRRANHFRFLHIASSFLAAQECVAYLRQTVGDLDRIGAVVNPNYFTTLHAYLPGSAFVFILKALAPEIALVDFKSGQRLPGSSILGLKIGVELLESTPPSEIVGANALVLPFGIKDSWREFISPDASVATVSTMFPAPYDYTLGSSVRTPDYPMQINSIVAEPTVNGLFGLYYPVLTQLWLPRLESLKNDCEEFLSRVQPDEIVVCDHTFPESAFLAASRSRETELKILTHDVAGVDVSLWDPEPRMSVFVGTNRAKLKWANVGSCEHRLEKLSRVTKAPPRSTATPRRGSAAYSDSRDGRSHRCIPTSPTSEHAKGSDCRPKRA